MSDTSAPPSPPSRPPEQRNGCVTALMIVAGIILLLPGLCALIFVFAGVAKTASDDLQVVAACLLVACFGVALIWWAIRRPAS
ncbi:hypothetical protein CK489_09195 [Bradyrhizobium sp. UFLA03-84]|uniref:hypothetical protein n=1 Tax=Bradyrhizobium sp. UFLA03-84 TaxID=418599 RepID=UPI000BAE1B3F|nr:hypothetical protein [Bradyrhizobium sp. UFLA03-84]PAY09486.1 hypothetical protein CK489_09195 [Bradyrhizobium sp. UFLA03-84]